MKPKLLIILTYFLLFIAYCFLPHSAFADFTQTQNDYNTSLDLYRAANSDYQNAKNAYLTYNTLNSQNEALVKTKTFLEARDQVLITYFFLLREKLAATNGLSDDDKNLTRDLLANRLSFLQNHKASIATISSLGDTADKSKEVDNNLSEIKNDAYKTLGQILIGKVREKSSQTSASLTQISSIANGIKSTGTNTSKLDRWLIETGYKRDLAESKLQAAKDLFYASNITNDMQLDDNFTNAKNLVIQGNQYLKEAVFNAKEAVKEILSGPY